MDPTVVETAAGYVQGRRSRDGDVVLFRGIPFAAPPVGRLRFRPPQPPAPWPGVRDATSYGPSAPQNPGVMERLWGGENVVSEDCLTLNVWTNGGGDRRRPVLVWIHGGGFMTGSGSIPWYDGRTFVRSGDAVVVSLNYRLGPLGFLHLADLGGEAYASSGNCGILDQVCALRWVRDNIANFGGDPANVTVFGESAGGMSVGTLLGLPAARGLFRRAIPQSGACANVSSREFATRVAVETLEALGLPPGDPSPLQSMPFEQLLVAQEVVASRYSGRALAYQPVVDGVALPQAPLDAVAAGSAADVAVLCGTTLEEMKLFSLLDAAQEEVDPDVVVERARVFLGDRAPAMVELYQRSRPGASGTDIWTAMATDLVFRIPAIRLLEAQSSVATECWAYLFTMRSTAFGGALGSCHGMEIPFVFDNLSRAGVELFTGNPPGGPELAARMHRAWMAFAASGDPAHDDLPPWPRYETGRRATMELGSPCRVLDDPMGDERAAWAAL